MRAGDEMKKAMTYDAAEFLETDEDIVAYLNAALDDGDPALVSAALGDIARARGMTQLAKDTASRGTASTRPSHRQATLPSERFRRS